MVEIADPDCQRLTIHILLLSCLLSPTASGAALPTVLPPIVMRSERLSPASPSALPAPDPAPLKDRSAIPAPGRGLGGLAPAASVAGGGGFVPRTIPEQIADEVGMAIVGGQYADAARITEQELASQFDVSRGPVRDALRLLARRGLIEILPRRGNYVKSVSLDRIADLFNLRVALASYGARAMATSPVASYLDTFERRICELEELAPQADVDIGQFAFISTRAVAAVAKGSGNELLGTLMTDLANLSVWNVIWKHPLDYHTAKRRQELCNQLRKTQQAISIGDAGAAERSMRSLLEDIRDQSIATLRALRGEEVSPAKLARSDR